VAAEIVFLAHDPPEGRYAAEAFGHAIFTAADARDELTWMVRDAVVSHFDETSRPKIIRLSEGDADQAAAIKSESVIGIAGIRIGLQNNVLDGCLLTIDDDLFGIRKHALR
jgi:hypothetical protein